MPRGGSVSQGGGPVIRVPLRTYRIAPRKAAIEIDGARVSLYLPVYFGRRRWELNASDLAVMDRTRLAATSEFEQDDSDPYAGVVLRRGITIPYLPTTGPAAEPNLALLSARR